MLGFSLTLGALIADALELLVLFILIDVFISYLILFGVRISAYHPFVRFIRRVVNPLLDPVRRVLPPNKTGNMDFSPLIVILILQAIASVISH